MFPSLIFFETKAIARLLLSILATTVAVSWSTKTFSQPILSERVVVVAESSNQELADLVQQVASRG